MKLCSKMKTAFAIVCSVCCLLFSFALRAGDASSSKADEPVVIVFLTSSQSALHAMEQEFVTALNMSLDNFKVVSVDVREQPFAMVPLSQRLRIISKYTELHHAVASTWIDEDENGTVLLNLAAMSTGRALVRIIEAENSSSASEDLAFAAQELLGQAYLFEEKQTSSAVSHTVRQVKAQIPENTGDNTTSRPGLALLPFFEMGRGILGYLGPTYQVGGGMDLVIPVRAGWRARLGGGGLSGPNAPIQDGSVSASGVFLRTVLDYQKQIGVFYLGAALQIEMALQFMDVVLGESNSRDFTVLNIRTAVELNASIPISQRLRLFFGATVGTNIFQKRFLRQSNGSVALATSRMDWTGSAGILFII